MRVLLFHQHFNSREGSTGTRSYEFARRLIARGHEVTVVCALSALSVTGLRMSFVKGRREGDVDGIHVIEFESGYANSMNVAQRLFAFLRFAFAGIGLAMRRDYELIFCMSTPLTAGIPGIVASLLRRKPYIFEAGDLWPAVPKAMGVTNPFLIGGMSLLEWANYKSATFNIGLAPGIVSAMQAKGVPVEQTAMVPNGCDLDLFMPAQGPRPQIDGIGDDEIVAMFAGGHGRIYGLHILLEAAKILKSRGAANIRIVLIGDGAMKPDLIAQARRDGLDNVLFLEPMAKPALARFMQRADIALHVVSNVKPLYYCCSPNKFFDAIAQGLPVINTLPGWITELIESSGCGIDVGADNPKGLADALQKLAGDAGLRAEMGARGRQMASRDFDREKLTNRVVDIVERVAGAERVAGPSGGLGPAS